MVVSVLTGKKYDPKAFRAHLVESSAEPCHTSRLQLLRKFDRSSNPNSVRSNRGIKHDD
jgi:hypothetical protein